MTDLSGYYGSIAFAATDMSNNKKTRTWNYLNVGGDSSIAPTAAQLQAFNDKATTLAQAFNSLTTNAWTALTKLSLVYDDQFPDGDGEGSDD